MSSFAKLPKDIQEEIDAMLNKFDENKDGQIGIEELANIMKEFGIDASNEELHQAAADLDTNKNGKIDISEAREFFAGVRLSELE
jgi:Ca2+-binding EF-hand superfamily protein